MGENQETAGICGGSGDQRRKKDYEKNEQADAIDEALARWWMVGRDVHAEVANGPLVGCRTHKSGVRRPLVGTAPIGARAA